jgi:prepilin-type N-terminal cleavage/methylation domain-containing protein
LIRNLLRSESGYSLMEVLVAILLLSIAIIPMVGMFDAGLRAANTSGNYDKARALANAKLEEAKSQDYATVKSSFPSTACALDASDTDGEDTCSSLSAPAGYPATFTYSVTKQYLQPLGSGASQNFTNSTSATDTKIMKVTVTVNWSGNSYSTTGVIADGA